MKRRTIAGLGLAAALIVVVAGAALAIRIRSTPAEFQGGVLSPVLPAPDFVLPTADGGSFRLSEQRGKVVLLFFGYTSCPDVCPTTLLDAANVRKRLSKKEASRVQLVFVTVDPERDTPARVSQYLDRFDPSFIGLVPPDEAAAHETVRAYKADFVKDKPNPGGGYAVAHPASIYAIDPAGRWRLLLPFGMSVDALTDDVRLLLRAEVSDD